MNKKITFFGISLIALVGLVAGANTVYADDVVTTCSTATFNGSVTPNGSTTEAWFNWGTTSALGYETSRQTFTTNSNFSQTITGLIQNNTYYYRAMASSVGGIAEGALITFVLPACTTTPPSSLPTVSTNTATSIATNSVLLNGYVDPVGTSDTTRWFEWGTTSSLGNQTTHYSQGSIAGNYSSSLVGLASNTTYYYRAVAQNAQGTVYGSILSFTTSYSSTGTTSLPTVSTNTATSIATNSVLLNGYVDPVGTSDTTRWFEWGTSTGFGNSTIKLSQGSSAGSFNAVVSSLASNTTYYYRAVAQNAQGTVYGSILSFTTSYGYTDTVYANTTAPVATTLLVTEVTSSVAKLNGLVFTSASQASNAWFEWGTNTNVVNRTQTINVGALPSIKHSEFITGLTRGQTYYYRIVAENPYGKSYGGIVSFVAEGTTITPVDTNVVITVPAPSTTVRNTTTIINQGSGAQSLVALAIDGGTEVIFSGEKRGYNITWKNESTQSLKNVVLRITLPSSMNFESATGGSYSSVDNTVTVDLKTLTTKQNGELFVLATADRRLAQGQLVVVTANMVYTDTRGVQGDAIAYATHRGEPAQNGLGANLFGAGDFLPSSLFEWLILLMLVLILVLLGNHLYGRFSKDER